MKKHTPSLWHLMKKLVSNLTIITIHNTKTGGTHTKRLENYWTKQGIKIKKDEEYHPKTINQNHTL